MTFWTTSMGTYMDFLLKPQEDIKTFKTLSDTQRNRIFVCRMCTVGWGQFNGAQAISMVLVTCSKLRRPIHVCVRALMGIYFCLKYFFSPIEMFPCDVFISHRLTCSRNIKTYLFSNIKVTKLKEKTILLLNYWLKINRRQPTFFNKIEESQ